jgi:hypothetical protein
MISGRRASSPGPPRCSWSRSRREALAGGRPLPGRALVTLFLSATTGSLTPFSDPTKMFSTIAEFAWNTSSACPGKSSLSEPETGLIGHDQRDSTLPKRLDRFIAVAHSAIGARTTTVTPMGHPHPYRFSTFGLGECGCAALDRCFEPSHRLSLNLYLAAIKRLYGPSPGQSSPQAVRRFPRSLILRR